MLKKEEQYLLHVAQIIYMAADICIIYMATSLQTFLNFLMIKKDKKKKQNNLQDYLINHLKTFQKEGQKKFPEILDSTRTE